MVSDPLGHRYLGSIAEDATCGFDSLPSRFFKNWPQLTMRLTALCLLSCNVLAGGLAAGQTFPADPIKPNATPAPAQAPAPSPDAKTPKFRVYVGTYTNSKSKSEGIYTFDFDGVTGALTNQSVAAKTDNPSFLAFHPTRKFLYAVNEVGQYGGKPTGSVSGFAIDPKTGGLSPLNSESSGGADPCYLTVDATGSDVLVANYSGGSVSVLPVGADGKLGPARSTIQHRGSSVNKSNQSGPHAHSVDLDSTNRVAVVADLGLDKVMVYRFDPGGGTLQPNIPPFASLPPGSGPRHLAFAPDGRHAYVINEISCTITVFDYDQARGSFAALQTISTKPDPVKPGDSTAEVVVHPSGRFVYGSNRGPDTLAIYSADPASGKLTLVGFQPTGGKSPRNFAIDPTGQFLLAANQNSDTIRVFRVDQGTGRLAPVGEPAACPSPVCIRFLPVPSE